MDIACVFLGFSKVRGTDFAVPKVRIIVFGVNAEVPWKTPYIGRIVW